MQLKKNDTNFAQIILELLQVNELLATSLSTDPPSIPYGHVFLTARNLVKVARVVNLKLVFTDYVFIIW